MAGLVFCGFSVLVVCRFLWLFDLPFLVANDQKLNEIVIFKWNMSFLTTQEKRERAFQD